MKKLMAGLLAACMLMFAACGALAEDVLLTVQGEGVVSLESDTATIMLGIRKFAADVKAAQQAVNRNMEAVIAALVEAGVDKTDIYTNSISIYPEYSYDSSYSDDENADIRGYSASNSITLVTTDIDNVGAIIDAAFEAGANTLDDVSFSASDTREASDQALRLAVQSATDKAQVLADAAGMALDGIVSIQEGDSYSFGGTARYVKNTIAEEDAAAGTQVLASRQQVSASVTVQFRLKEK